MAISRRRFIKSGTLVVLSAGLPLKVAAESLNPDAAIGSGVIGPTTTNGSQLDLNSFSKYLKTDFQLSGPGVPTVRAKLIEVHDLKSQAKGSATNAKSKECFSAVFVASASAPFAQDTYNVEHPSLGKFSMFVVPRRQGTNGIQYEAVFNRL